jgi:hypothetical protein
VRPAGIAPAAPGLAALVTLVAIVALPRPLAAQDVEASLSRDTIGLDESVEYRVTVAAGGVAEIGEPRLPLPPGLTLFGRSRSSEVSISNGRVERRTTFSLVYRPFRTGAVRIGPASVEVGGTRHVVPSLTLVVTDPRPRPLDPAAGAPPGGAGADRARPAPAEPLPGDERSTLPPVFVTNRLDRDEVYVGEQAVLTFAFYQSPRAMVLDQPNYASAKTPGFWTQDFNREPEIARELVGGEPYTVQRFHYALFALTPGEKRIDPATLTLTLRNPFSFLDRGRTRTLSGDTLRLRVKPLPSAGRPPGFAGAVGSWRLSAELEPRRVERGAPATLTVTVSGRGNVATLPPPRVDSPAGVRVFDPEVTTALEPRGLSFGGRKTFRYLVVPDRAGRLELGEVSLPVFDPRAGGYRVASAPLGALTVREPPGGGGPAADGRPGALAEPGGRGLDEAPGNPLRNPWLWVAGIGLPAAIALAALAGWRRAAARGRGAVGTGRAAAAASRVRGGRGLPSAPGPATAVPGVASDRAGPEARLLRRLEALAGRPLAGLSVEARERALREAGLSADAASRAAAAMRALDAVGFAPPALRAEAEAAAAGALRAFDEEVRRPAGRPGRRFGFGARR